MRRRARASCLARYASRMRTQGQCVSFGSMKATTIKLDGVMLEELKAFKRRGQNLTALVRELLKASDRWRSRPPESRGLKRPSTRRYAPICRTEDSGDTEIRSGGPAGQGQGKTQSLW